MQERLHEDLERQLESIERAKEDMERAAERGEVALADGKALDLTAYEYQGRPPASSQDSRPGLLKQRTGDDFETVSRFYQRSSGSRSSGSASATTSGRSSRPRTRPP